MLYLHRLLSQSGFMQFTPQGPPIFCKSDDNVFYENVLRI